MKQLVEYILTNITQKPEKVQVTETIDDNGLHLINISVDPEDMGRVIGKSGKVIHAIRNLVRVAAIQKNLRVRVMLEDSQTDKPEDTTPDKSSEATKEEAQEPQESESTEPQAQTEVEPEEETKS